MKASSLYLIIGAGPVGLAQAKALKDQNIPYEQVEAAEQVGGNWFHGTYKSAHILSARRVMEYSDFPMPADYPDFPSSAQMLRYYENYAETFDLLPQITFNTKVIHVIPTENNLWHVAFNNGTQKTYKGVLVCNGHHWDKRFPKYPGSFEGESIHSKDYKTPDQVKDKKVLVIGAGNSAFDIASESARNGESTSLSVRRGVWIFPKTFMGKPLASINAPKMPDWLRERLIRLMLRITIGKHENYGLPKPEIKVFDRHPTVNTETLMHIKHGRIKVKPAIKKLLPNGVEYADGSQEKLDLIVYATGFHTSFPFLPKALNRVEKNHVKVYGMSMYPDYKGLYLVGWMQPRGGVGSLIGPYSKLLAEFIKTQEALEIPVGRVLKEMGDPLPTSHLYGGDKLIEWCEKTMKKMHRIENKGSALDKKLGSFQNPVLPTPVEETSKHTTQKAPLEV